MGERPTLSTLWSLTLSKHNSIPTTTVTSNSSRRISLKTTAKYSYYRAATFPRLLTVLTRTWLWPSVLTPSTLTITHSLTHAQRPAVQAAPSSVGFNGPLVLTKMTVVMIVALM